MKQSVKEFLEIFAISFFLTMLVMALIGMYFFIGMNLLSVLRG